MRNEPTGKYVVKYEGKPLAARVYHLYFDCGYMLALTANTVLGPAVVEPSDEIIALMEMKVCAGCESRSLEVPAEDVIAEAIGCDLQAASKALAALEANGYVIKHVKKRNQTKTEK